jgi:hypothetical protein
MVKPRQKQKRFHKVKTAGGGAHHFTAREVSLNKLASRKINFKKLQKDLSTEQTLLDASDIPIR